MYIYIYTNCIHGAESRVLQRGGLFTIGERPRGANSNLVLPGPSFRVVYEKPARILREQIKIEGEYERNAVITRRKRSALPLAFMAEGFTMVMGRDKAVITADRGVGDEGGEGALRRKREHDASTITVKKGK